MAKTKRAKKVTARRSKRATSRRTTKSSPRRRAVRRTAVRVEQVVTTVDRLPKIGDEFGGGIFVGIIREPGKPDRGLVAHKDRGTDQPLGTFGKEVNGADSQSNGFANTEAFAAAGSEAAKKVRALRDGGFEDWYIPSRKELRLCEANLADLFDGVWHWSSTQASATYAYVVGFAGGSQTWDGKGVHGRVRAVRSFVL